MTDQSDNGSSNGPNTTSVGETPKRARKPKLAVDAMAKVLDVETPEAVGTAEADQAGAPKSLREQMQLLPLPGAPMKMRDGDREAMVEPGEWRYGWEQPGNGLPLNCPVIPLGKAPGAGGFYFLDPLGNVYLLKPSAGKGEISALFSPFSKYLLWAWPRKHVKKSRDSGDEVVDNFHAELAREDLFDAASVYGTFDPQGIVRGRGCWRDDDGQLIYHAGDMILKGQTWHKPGRIGAYIYPSKRAIGKPRAHKHSWQAGQYLIEQLRSWNWERPEVDADFMLGWMVVGLLGAVLKVRPILWVTGQEGSGKSTLFDFLTAYMGKALLTAADATAAQIYQTLKEDVLPVILDEQEAEADTRKTDAIIKLARIAYSGGTLGRGGQDGVPVNYELRAPFFCSSIVRPSMNAQDESRMITLTMSPLKEGQAGAAFDYAEIAEWGEVMRGRIIERFEALDAAMATTKAYLRSAGYDSRAADTVGTIIACHHVALYDGAIEEKALCEWVEKCPAPVKTVTWQRMFAFMLETRPEAFKDPKAKDKSIEAIIASFKQEYEASANIPDNIREAMRAANAKLSDFGMSFEFPADSWGWADLELFVPNAHAGMVSLFAGSQWAGRVGVTGPWSGVLKQAQAQNVTRSTGDKPIKRHGRSMRGNFIHIARAMGSYE